jgi:hypothetical protein
MMALEVYFKDDLRYHITGAVVLAVETSTAHGLTNVEHLGGILTMGKGLALSFGLSWGAILGDCQQALGDDLGGLLDQVRQIESG